MALDSPHWELVGIVEMRAGNNKRAADHYGLGGGGDAETSGSGNLKTVAMVLGACRSVQQKRTVCLVE